MRALRHGAANRAALDYAVTSATAIAVPLLVAALTGHSVAGALVALGAFLVANATPEGPYGVRARQLFATVAVMTAGVLVGGLASGHRWAVVVAVPLAVAIGAAVPRSGLIWALATLLAAVRPSPVGLIATVLLEMTGGLWLAVLFLIPWPHRRLRPILVAVTEAVEELAALLESVSASDAEWDDRRIAARDALAQARAASGLYPAGHGGLSRPGRLIDAVTRMLHEMVALRALTVALRKQETERKLRPAIAMLSTRIHGLARTIETAGRVPLTERGSVVPRRTSAWLEEERRVALASEKVDLVDVALALQMQGTINRLAITVKSAGDIVRTGLAPGTAVPRLPWRVRPVTLWRAVRSDVKTRSPRLRRATRAGAAAVVAMVIWMSLRIPHAYWFPIAVVLCMRHSYGETASRVVHQVAGSAAGAIVGALLLVLAPGQVVVVAAIYCLALGAYALSSISYVVRMTFTTPVIMMLVDYSTRANWLLATERIELTVAGGVLALMAARSFWPASGERTVLTDRMPALCETDADLMRAIACRIQGLDEPLAESFAAAGEAMDEANESLRRLTEEPSPRTELITALQQATAAAQRLKDDLITINDLSSARPVDAGPIPALLDQVADFLEATARDLRAGHLPAATELNLDGRLTELDGFLTETVRRRRAEVAAGDHLHELTPLRRMLGQAAAARHAVRTLRANTEDLTRALVKGCRAEGV
jgi:uncharacterized membrane protein YccC